MQLEVILEGILLSGEEKNRVRILAGNLSLKLIPASSMVMILFFLSGIK